MLINVGQWRSSIGLFHCKKTSNGNFSARNNDFFIVAEIIALCSYLNIPIQIFTGMLVVLAFSSAVLILITFMFSWYLSCSVICTVYSPRCHFPPFIPFVQYSFSIIFQTPNISSHVIKSLQSYLRFISSFAFINFAFFIFVLQTLLILSGNVAKNPGPSQPTKTKLSFAIWNLDSLPAREFARIPLIETFQATYSFDLFGVVESSLNNSIKNESIFISGYSPDPFRADKPETNRCGGVCLYFKEGLPIKRRSDLEILPETIVAEIKLSKRKIFIILSYCHPNLPSIEFDEYTRNLEQIYVLICKENPSITILTGDFNARSPLFWENDTETREGR